MKDITDTTNARLEIIAAREVRTFANVVSASHRQAFDAVLSDGYETERKNLGLAVERLQESMRDDLDATERDALLWRVRFHFYKWIVYPPQDAFQRWRPRRRSA